MQLGDLGWALGSKPSEGIMCHLESQLSHSVILLATGSLTGSVIDLR